MSAPESPRKATPGTIWQFEVRASLSGNTFLLKHSAAGGVWQEAQKEFNTLLDEARASFEPELYQRVSSLFEGSASEVTVDLQGKKFP